MDRRFGGDAYWRSAFGKASDEATAFWIDGGIGAAMHAAAAFQGSWCPDGRTFAEFSFTLENGKTVSVCEDAGSSDLTYFCGILGKPPGTGIPGPSSRNDRRDKRVQPRPRRARRFRVRRAAAGRGRVAGGGGRRGGSPGTGSFFPVRSVGCCGGEEAAILFRRRGWEYAARMGYSRNVIPDVASERGDYSEWKLITLISPGGQDHDMR